MYHKIECWYVMIRISGCSLERLARSWGSFFLLHCSLWFLKNANLYCIGRRERSSCTRIGTSTRQTTICLWHQWENKKLWEVISGEASMPQIMTMRVIGENFMLFQCFFFFFFFSKQNDVFFFLKIHNQ